MDVPQVNNTAINTEGTFQKNRIVLIVAAIVLFILSLISAFIGGYYLNEMNKQDDLVISSPTPIPASRLPDEKLIDETVITEGQGYYDDTIIAVTNDNPKKVLVATATRQETEQGANQSTRTSFFDGANWTRKLLTQSYPTTGIYTNSIIKDWQIKIDPTRVLKQTVSGKLTIDQNLVNFTTGMLTNNIGIRSLPGYTKFMSNSEGKLEVNGSFLPAKILYTRIYSNNSQEMQFYNSSLGLTTHWLAFWDNDGNFYHIDSTAVDKPTDVYQAHKFGVMVDRIGRVTKTFDVEVNYSQENPPNSYQITLGEPVNKNLNFTIGKSINKAPSNSYSWFMSEGVGKAGGLEGYGLVEYIKN